MVLHGPPVKPDLSPVVVPTETSNQNHIPFWPDLNLVPLLTEPLTQSQILNQADLTQNKVILAQLRCYSLNRNAIAKSTFPEPITPQEPGSGDTAAVLERIKTNEMVACVGRIELSCFLFPSSDSPRTTEEEVCPDAVVPPSRWSNPHNIAVATWSAFKYLLQTSCSSDRELLPLEKSAVAKVLQQTLAWPTEYTSTNQPTNHTASPNRYRLSSCCHVRSRLAQTKPGHI